MHKSIERDLITCAEAAEILGISKAAVYAGLRKGIVRYGNKYTIIRSPLAK